jgi:hypothetical protein
VFAEALPNNVVGTYKYPVEMFSQKLFFILSEQGKWAENASPYIGRTD